MSDRWLVVTDLDGTLLNHHDYRADAALPVMQQLERRQIPVIFNTSKTFSEVETIAHSLNNRHPFIVENGSAIVIPSGYFRRDLLHAEFDQVQSSTSHDSVIIGSGINSIQLFLQQLRPPAIDFSQCSVQQAMQLTGLQESEARAAQARQFSVPLMFSNSEDEQAFIAAATAAGFTTLKGGRFLHILGNCNKGHSMLLLRQLYQQSQACHFGIVALGDSPNDLDMLQAADQAVIVRSPSSDQLKLQHQHAIYTQHSAPQGWAEGVQASRAFEQASTNQHLTYGEHHGG